MQQLKKRIITIDGPSGSGKSTVAGKMAQVLGFYHLNSGMIFRATTFIILKNQAMNWSGVFINSWFDLLNKFTVNFDEKKLMKICFDNVEITEKELSSEKIIELVPKLSALKEIQDFVFKLQHKLSEEYDLIVDGRNCGSEVFPNADAKIFLTASIEQRGIWISKRILDISGKVLPLYEIMDSIKQRDFLDETRIIAPLKKAADAFLIDSTGLSLMNVLKKSVCFAATKIDFAAQRRTVSPDLKV